MANRFVMNALRLVLGAVKASGRKGGAYAKEAVKNILVINTTAMGDTLLSTPAIRALRLAFPDARMTALAGESAEMVLRDNPRIDGIIRHPGRMNARYFLRLPGLLRDLRKGAFDLAVVLHGNDPDATALALLSGARTSLGMTRTALGDFLTWYAPCGTDGHVITQRLDALRALGIESSDVGMEFFPTKADEESAGRFLASNGVSAGATLVALHPFGSKPTRQWPVESAARLVDALHERFGWRAVILGGKRELSQGEEIARLARSARPVIATGRTSLGASAAIMKRCALAVSTDSGPLHVAQAMGVPCVALIGSTKAGNTGPIEKNCAVAFRPEACLEERPCKRYDCGHMSCMKAITPDEVIDAAIRLLDVRA